MCSSSKERGCRQELLGPWAQLLLPGGFQDSVKKAYDLKNVFEIREEPIKLSSLGSSSTNIRKCIHPAMSSKHPRRKGFPMVECCQLLSLPPASILRLFTRTTHLLLGSCVIVERPGQNELHSSCCSQYPGVSLQDTPGYEHRSPPCSAGSSWAGSCEQGRGLEGGRWNQIQAN